MQNNQQLRRLPKTKEGRYTAVHLDIKKYILPGVTGMIVWGMKIF